MVSTRNILVVSALAMGAWGCSARVGPEVRQISSTAPSLPSGSSMAQGRILFGRGEYALAIEEFRKAIREAPQSPEGYNGLASAYDMIGRFDLASRNYEMALAYAPDDGRIYRNMARSLKMQGRTGEAEALLAEWDAIKSKAPGASEVATAVSPKIEESVPSSGALPVQVAAAPLLTVPAAPAAPAPVLKEQPSPATPVVAIQTISRGQSLHIDLDAPVTPPATAPIAPRARPTTPARTLVVPRADVVSADAPVAVRTAAFSAIRIMNAGARKGAAQKMQTLLARNGTPSRIADANRRLAQSWIVYPKYAKADAMALQGRLPINVRTIADNRVRRVTLLLGQDAAPFLARIGKSARRG